jgi:hypothetical protein
MKQTTQKGRTVYGTHGKDDSRPDADVAAGAEKLLPGNHA